MTVDIDPLAAALDQYSAAYERLAEHEQRARLTDVDLANDIGAIAEGVRRGFEDEFRDAWPVPEAKEDCIRCALATGRP